MEPGLLYITNWLATLLTAFLQVEEGLVYITDWLATLLTAAGLPVPQQLDRSTSLMLLLVFRLPLHILTFIYRFRIQCFSFNVDLDVSLQSLLI